MNVISVKKVEPSISKVRELNVHWPIELILTCNLLNVICK